MTKIIIESGDFGPEALYKRIGMDEEDIEKIKEFARHRNEKDPKQILEFKKYLNGKYPLGIPEEAEV
jgi:pyruvate-formate lyase-activating enzyme